MKYECINDYPGNPFLYYVPLTAEEIMQEEPDIKSEDDIELKFSHLFKRVREREDIEGFADKRAADAEHEHLPMDQNDDY